MTDNDLIRRGDALKTADEELRRYGFSAPEGRRYDMRDAIAALPAVTVGVMDFDVEVVRGNTGGNLALYFNDHRVAGSKPWGGGTPIHQFRVQGDDAKSAGILATIRDFQTVPVVKECLTTDAALPAVTPAPDAAAIREAALREARQRVNDLVAERQADLHGARNDFNRGAVDALQEACSVILALIPKGGA